MKKASFKFYDIRMVFNEPHFKVETRVFVDMARGAVFLGAINISRCEYLLEYFHHNLFIELRACRKKRGVAEIFYRESRSAPFRVSPSNFRNLYLGKPFFAKKITERFNDMRLYAKNRP